jgi:hypothetical protein
VLLDLEDPDPEREDLPIFHGFSAPMKWAIEIFEP